MGEFELIFFVAIAGFFAYKLWTVLGRTNGDEESRAAEIVIAAKEKQAVKAELKAIKIPESKIVQLFEEEIPEKFKKEIEGIKKIDPSFSLKKFLTNASVAFETVIEAYSNANEKRLKFLLNDEIYGDFAKDLEGYAAKDQKAHVTLVSLDEPEIVDVELKGKTAHITLEFASEQINFVENKKGEVAEGSKTRIERAIDSWVFERDLSSLKPQWLVVGTDA